MKKLLSLNLLIFILVNLSLQAGSPESDVHAIKAVIQSAYIEGIHNNGDLSATEAGFHPAFEMLIMRDNKLEKLPIATWIESMKQRRAKEEPVDRPEVTGKYLNVDVTGDAAVVKLELHREGILLFTDYLCLYRFEDGWKIVSKLFHRH